MQPVYIIQDENNVSGQFITCTQGESKTAKLFLFNADGSPFFISGTISEIVIKIFSTINAASIVKKLSLSQVTKIADSTLGCFGFQWLMASADTAAMAANNTGLPGRVTLTMSDGTTKEYDFVALFLVEPPTVNT